MNANRSFAGDPDEIAQARKFVAEELDGRSATVVDNAVLLVSELATNAVRHVGSAFTVAVEDSRSAVRISVSDSGGGEPRARPLDVGSTDGRGLHIVGSLASAWGIEPTATGKTVWFTLAA